MRNGAAIQSALAFTGATSVPRVFIGGKFVGGELRSPSRACVFIILRLLVSPLALRLIILRLLQAATTRLPWRRRASCAPSLWPPAPCKQAPTAAAAVVCSWLTFIMMGNAGPPPVHDLGLRQAAGCHSHWPSDDSEHWTAPSPITGQRASPTFLWECGRAVLLSRLVRCYDTSSP